MSVPSISLSKVVLEEKSKDEPKPIMSKSLEKDRCLLDSIERQEHNRLSYIFRYVDAAGVKVDFTINTAPDKEIARTSIASVRRTDTSGLLLIRALEVVMIARRKVLALHPTMIGLQDGIDTCTRLLQRLVQIKKERNVRLELDDTDPHTKSVLEKLYYMRTFPYSFMSTVFRGLAFDTGLNLSVADDWQIAYEVMTRVKADAVLRKNLRSQLKECIKNERTSDTFEFEEGRKLGVKYCEILLNML